MRRTRTTQPGFSLIEATMASAILLFAVVALTQSLVAGQGQTYKALHSARAVSLADALLEEVLSQPWNDPDGESTPGPDADESDRADFDNLDDYHGYTEAAGALADAAGVTYGALHQGFDRAVAVVPASTSDPTLGEREGVEITVTVSDETGRAWTVRRFVGASTATAGAGS